TAEASATKRSHAAQACENLSRSRDPSGCGLRLAISAAQCSRSHAEIAGQTRRRGSSTPPPFDPVCSATTLPPFAFASYALVTISPGDKLTAGDISGGFQGSRKCLSGPRKVEACFTNSVPTLPVASQNAA